MYGDLCKNAQSFSKLPQPENIMKKENIFPSEL